VNHIGDRNVNLPIDSKCKNFALKSRCTVEAHACHPKIFFFLALKKITKKTKIFQI